MFSKTIKLYFCNLRSIYVDKKFFDFFVFKYLILNNVIRDIKHVQKNNIIKKRKSIIKNVLLKILNIFDTLIY